MENYKVYVTTPLPVKVVVQPNSIPAINDSGDGGMSYQKDLSRQWIVVHNRN